MLREASSMPRAVGGFVLALFVFMACDSSGADDLSADWAKISQYFTPPAHYAGQFGDYRSPLLFGDGPLVKTPQDWRRRREEILDHWHGVMGEWPAVIERPAVELIGEVRRENFTQRKVRVETAHGQTTAGYLLIPDGAGPFPAVFVPFYEPETSTGQNQNKLRDFAY